MILLALCAVLIGLAAFIRLAPSDPTRWHVDPGALAVTACSQLTKTSASAQVTCVIDSDPATLMAKLDSIALATPRTVRLAGSAENGRITWVTRSLIWGFPDYTTAQATPTETGTRLDVIARLRFGGADTGVNAARLTAWLGQL